MGTQLNPSDSARLQPNEAVRLLVASNYFESHKGGIEIVAGQLARALATGQGFDVAWLAANASASAPDGPVRSIALRSWNGIERLLGLPIPLPLPGAIAAILREVRSSDIVMLHDTLYPSNLVAMLCAKRLDKPVLIVQHIGLVPYRNPIARALMKFADRFVSRPMLAKADQVVFISGLTAQHFSGVRFRRPPQLIFNGIREELWGGISLPSRDRLSPDSPFTAIFVGRFVEKKGLPILRRLATAMPHVRWLICGWGDERPEAWGLANVEVRRNLNGMQLRRAYNEAHLLVLPSVGEGLPLVVQEALALGLAVIGGADLFDADPWLRGRISGVAVDSRCLEKTVDQWQREVERIAQSWPRPNYASETRDRYSWSSISREYATLICSMARPTSQTGP
jgi:glycosyltransferase involved in cell wall biosynthesis